MLQSMGLRRVGHDLATEQKLPLFALGKNMFISKEQLYHSREDRCVCVCVCVCVYVIRSNAIMSV